MLHFFSVVVTFSLATIGLIFFRADSLQQVYLWWYHLLFNFTLSPMAIELFLKTLIYGAPLLVVDFFLYKNENLIRFLKYPVAFRYALFYIAFYLMVVFHSQGTNFIYFQF